MSTGIKRVAAIIAARDGVSLEDAIERVKECRDMMIEALGQDDDPEEILAYELGLEPDYIYDLM